MLLRTYPGRSIRRLVALIAVGMVTTACSSASGPGSPIRTNPPEPTTQSATPTAIAPAVVRTSLPTPRPRAPSISTPYVPVLPQSIHSYINLNDFIAEAQINVNDFWLHQWFPLEQPYAPPQVTLMQPGQEMPCGGGLTQWTSFYCPSERAIYLYQPALQSVNSSAGYAAMYAMLAHEWTHHVQLIIGVPPVRPQLELQADCGSGMFLAAAWPHMADSDLQPVRRMLSTTPTDTIHGTPAQRVQAFDDGYRLGAAVECGLILPSEPYRAVLG